MAGNGGGKVRAWFRAWELDHGREWRSRKGTILTCSSTSTGSSRKDNISRKGEKVRGNV